MDKPTVSGIKDAVHIAYITCEIHGRALKPGQKVWVNGESFVCEETNGNGHGIVDPWAKGSLNPGSIVMVLLDPECIGKIRHVFDLEDVGSDIDDDYGDSCKSMGCS